jgi:hypothetical protein
MESPEVLRRRSHLRRCAAPPFIEIVPPIEPFGDRLITNGMTEQVEIVPIVGRLEY